MVSAAQAEVERLKQHAQSLQAAAAHAQSLLAAAERKAALRPEGVGSEKLEAKVRQHLSKCGGSATGGELAALFSDMASSAGVVSGKSGFKKWLAGVDGVIVQSISGQTNWQVRLQGRVAPAGHHEKAVKSIPGKTVGHERRAASQQPKASVSQVAADPWAGGADPWSALGQQRQDRSTPVIGGSKRTFGDTHVTQQPKASTSVAPPSQQAKASTLPVAADPWAGGADPWSALGQQRKERPTLVNQQPTASTSPAADTWDSGVDTCASSGQRKPVAKPKIGLSGMKLEMPKARALTPPARMLTEVRLAPPTFVQHLSPQGGVVGVVGSLAPDGSRPSAYGALGFGPLPPSAGLFGPSLFSSAPSSAAPRRSLTPRKKIENRPYLLDTSPVPCHSGSPSDRDTPWPSWAEVAPAPSWTGSSPTSYGPTVAEANAAHPAAPVPALEQKARVDLLHKLTDFLDKDFEKNQRTLRAAASKGIVFTGFGKLLVEDVEEAIAAATGRPSPMSGVPNLAEALTSHPRAVPLLPPTPASALAAQAIVEPPAAAPILASGQKARLDLMQKQQRRQHRRQRAVRRRRRHEKIVARLVRNGKLKRDTKTRRPMLRAAASGGIVFTRIEKVNVEDVEESIAAAAGGRACLQAIPDDDDDDF